MHLSRQIEQLKRCEIIPEAVVKDVCVKAKEILMEEGNVQYVDSPVTVSGHLSSAVRCSCSSSCCRYAEISMANSST